ncbi:unnamed protein product [Protopolystoma xenopodis]|uniref:Globin domain-containing protein n=1 Tax=Protopolystoma xenopodis TaxID=117903 RepID=A0A448X814_9PLAT|nr:unnamed protein product [Protopolystoma xenopodis]
MRNDPRLQAHGLRVLQVVDKLISRIDRTDIIEPFLLMLGGRHIKYKATPLLVPVGDFDYHHAHLKILFAFLPSRQKLSRADDKIAAQCAHKLHEASQ